MCDNFSLSYLSHLLGDGGEAFVLRLGVGEDVACLAQLGLQLQDPLFVVGLLTGRLLDEGLLAALPICCHLPVVGVGLSKGLEIKQRRVCGYCIVYRPHRSSNVHQGKNH